MKDASIQLSYGAWNPWNSCTGFQIMEEIKMATSKSNGQCYACRSKKKYLYPLVNFCFGINLPENVFWFFSRIIYLSHDIRQTTHTQDDIIQRSIISFVFTETFFSSSTVSVKWMCLIKTHGIVIISLSILWCGYTSWWCMFKWKSYTSMTEAGVMGVGQSSLGTWYNLVSVSAPADVNQISFYGPAGQKIS